MADKVFIRRFQVPVFIGCEPGERDKPQSVEMDFEITVLNNSAVVSGDPQDTVCYKRVCETVGSLMVDHAWPLLEQLGEDISHLIFERFPAAGAIKLTLRKFVIPHTESVGIEIFRERSI